MGNITIKTAEDIEGMRVAGRLAAEVLEMIVVVLWVIGVNMKRADWDVEK